ncbi:MAG: hypothetical protein P8L31_09750 [Pseudomonadales bacterium]|nr:hypothetical protein [Pseudomonadales bacterium]
MTLTLVTGGCLCGVYLLGLDAGTFFLLLVQKELASLWRFRERNVKLADIEIQQVWMVQDVLCVAGQQYRVWLFKDEFSAADWAQLRRQLIRQCPDEPVGLSISK